MRKRHDIYERLLIFSVKIVNICRTLSKERENRIIADQLLKAGTSVGANMHEADSAASKKDFINKVTIAKKEIQETSYWLMVIERTDLLGEDRDRIEIKRLLLESDELTKIIGSILFRTKRNEYNMPKAYQNS